MTVHPIFQPLLDAIGGVSKTVTSDPRDPDPTKRGIFRDHNCARCGDGAQPCVQGHPHQCEYPHARND